MADSFMLPTTESAEKYSELEEHVIHDSISLCHHLAGRLFGLRMGFYKRVSNLKKRDSRSRHRHCHLIHGWPRRQETFG